MDIQLNNNVFDQLTAGGDYTRHMAGLAAMMGHSLEQSFGLGWPGHRQAENGERTKNVALTHSSIDLITGIGGDAHRDCEHSNARNGRLLVNTERAKTNPRLPLGVAAEHTHVEIYLSCRS